MVIGAVCFSLMSLLIKLCSVIPSFQMVLARSTVCALGSFIGMLNAVSFVDIVHIVCIFVVPGYNYMCACKSEGLHVRCCVRVSVLGCRLLPNCRVPVMLKPISTMFLQSYFFLK